MKQRFCPHCEDDTNVIEKKVSIPVGAESFSIHTLVCKKCGHYALTPDLRKEMDQWGRSLTKNIVEPQPVFSEATHRFAEEMATQYGLKRVPFFRVLTAFYLNRVVNRDDFQELKKFCDAHAPRKLLDEGTRSKVSVPIRYLMYRKLQTFSEVWEISHARAIEEAVLFGLTVLSCKEANFEKLKTIADSLQQYITDIAEAA
ncbi:hypothetical protein WDW37_04095 [Bdellovibrionota bacterium FG-1]